MTVLYKTLKLKLCYVLYAGLKFRDNLLAWDLLSCSCFLQEIPAQLTAAVEAACKNDSPVRP